MENLEKENANINSKEYIINKDGKSHKILIELGYSYIIITSRQYQLKISNIQEFSKNYYNNFDSFEALYEFLIDLFEKNRAYISSISNNYMLIILMLFEEVLELKLPFHNLIPDRINYPINLTNDSFTYYNYTNSFLIFNSVFNRLYMIYTTQDKTIKVYDILDNVITTEIRNSTEDNKQITNFRHYYDENNKRDLFISIIGIKNCIKIWNANNWELIITIKDVYKEGNIYSSLILNDNNNQLYIITSNCTLFKDSQPIKIFDINGNYLKNIDDSNGKTFYLDAFNDIKNSKKYIIAVNKEFIKSFDFEKNSCYKKYSDSVKSDPKKVNFNGYFYSSVINYCGNNDKIELIVSGDDGFIRVWDFHEGLLIKKIETDKNCIFSLCLWSENYVFGAGEDGKIKLIDLKAGIIINELKAHRKTVCTVNKFIHPEFGECLISQGFRKDQILLWRNKNE